MPYGKKPALAVVIGVIIIYGLFAAGILRAAASKPDGLKNPGDAPPITLPIIAEPQFVLYQMTQNCFVLTNANEEVFPGQTGKLRCNLLGTRQLTSDDALCTSGRECTHTAVLIDNVPYPQGWESYRIENIPINQVGGSAINIQFFEVNNQANKIIFRFSNDPISDPSREFPLSLISLKIINGKTYMLIPKLDISSVKNAATSPILASIGGGVFFTQPGRTGY